VSISPGTHRILSVWLSTVCIFGVGSQQVLNKCLMRQLMKPKDKVRGSVRFSHGINRQAKEEEGSCLQRVPTPEQQGTRFSRVAAH
jgi:hypothetical protein